MSEATIPAETTGRAPSAARSAERQAAAAERQADTLERIAGFLEANLAHLQALAAAFTPEPDEDEDAPAWPCSQLQPEDQQAEGQEQSYRCSRERGHTGLHIARHPDDRTQKLGVWE